MCIRDSSEWIDPSAWMKANPGLGTIKKYEDLVEKVERAKSNPKDLPGILCKDFNVRETAYDAWLTFETANNEETFNLGDFRGSYAIGGVDLSSTTDLTCATILMMKPGDPKKYVHQMYWMPADLIEQRTIEDKIPYNAWLQRGLLRGCEGQKINYADITLSLIHILPPDKKSLIDNLKHQAAFMVSFMAELQETLDREGAVDQFEQGSQKFLREHPAAKIYNTTMRNYLSVIKQLLALLPPEEAKAAKDEFAAFIQKAVK